MRPLLPFIFSLLWATCLFGQADTVAVADTSAVPVKNQFVRLALRADYGKLLPTAFGLQNKWEGSAYLLFYNQFFLQADYGRGVLEPEGLITNGWYRSEGSYYRVGGGYNAQLNAQSKLGIGVQYALGEFTDEGVAEISSADGVQGNNVEINAPRSSEARWVEFLLTSETQTKISKKNPEARINQIVALGFDFRLRFMSVYYPRADRIDVLAIPGYGRLVNRPNPALNLFVKIYLF